MNALAKALLSTVALGALLLALPSPATSASLPTTTPVQFGMDSAAIADEKAAGAAPDYGTFWIGPWTLTSGWGGPDAQLDAMRNAGVTPAIHFYYWGDDISQSCLENGCWSTEHNAQKDKAHWQMLADQLVSHLNSRMQGKPVLIFLETEFNKGDVATYEPLDGYLTDKVDQIHQGYPAAKVVMSLGNWDSKDWVTWDRTAAASDYVGIQGLRGSTRQSATDYATLTQGLLAGAKTLQADFGKPVVLQDIGLSSYTEPDWLDDQANEVKDLFAHLGDLRALGVQAILYRSWKDSPSMCTCNYYGEAERHWGLAWAGNGTQKPAGKAWIAGVQAERAGHSNHAPAAAFDASPSGLTVAVDASASSDPDGQALTYAWTFGDGATASGRTATHAFAAGGTYTVGLTVSDGSLSSSTSKPVAVTKPNAPPVAAFTASAGPLSVAVDGSASSDPDGDALSYAWAFGDGATATGPTATHAYASPGTYAVALTVSDGKATSSASQTVGIVRPNAPPTAAFTASASQLTVAVDGSGSSDPDGDSLSYAWAFGDGATAGGKTASHGYAAAGTYTVTLTVSDGKATSSASKAVGVSKPAYAAAFTTRSASNEYWEQVGVAASPAPAKVELQVNGGAWTAMKHESYGDWTSGVHIPKGTPMAYRATAADGSVAVSATQPWLGAATATSTSTAPAPSPSPSTSSTTTTTARPTTTTTTTSATASAFRVTFSPKAVGNDWWVETGVTANAPVAKVEAKVDSGAWVQLPLDDWGTYAKSIHAPNGSHVTFRATSPAGTTYTSAAVTWT